MDNLNLGPRFLRLGFGKLLANRFYFKGSEKPGFLLSFSFWSRMLPPRPADVYRTAKFFSEPFLAEAKSLDSHWPKGSILRPPMSLTIGLETQGGLGTRAASCLSFTNLKKRLIIWRPFVLFLGAREGHEVTHWLR